MSVEVSDEQLLKGRKIRMLLCKKEVYMKRKWRFGVAAALLAGGLAVALPGNVHAEEKGIEINETNFPDERFREYVKQFDTGGDPYYWFYLGDEDP